VVVKTGPDPAVVPAQGAGAPVFGLIDIRGRTLSPDATFGVSKAETPADDDIKIVFDFLQPRPDDKAGIRKPRVVDADGSEFARRLLLVCDTSDQGLKDAFQAGSKHTLTITNPDSQSAILVFTAS
jgi:hypothetical protein